MSVTKILTGLILAVNLPHVAAWCDYNWYYNSNDCYNGYNGYNRYGNNSQNEIRFSGAPAWGMKDGEYTQMPVEQCEFGCAVGAMCGSETECAIGSVVIFIVLGIFGCFVVVFFTVFCCVFCRAVKESSKHDQVIVESEKDIHAPMIHKKHKSDSSSDESDKEKKAKKYNPEAQYM